MQTCHGGMQRAGRAAIIPILLGAMSTVTGCAPAKDKAIIGQAEQFQSGLSPAEVQDPQVTQYLQAIGQRIVMAGKQFDAKHDGPPAHFEKSQSEDWMFKDIQFHLVNSKTLNAFTTGGQHVYIYNELLQLCQNEDQLAAVMSHEYGHIYCRHVQAGTPRQSAQALVAMLGGGAGSLVGGQESGTQYANLASTIASLGGAKFSREDEAEADKYGFKFYSRAGWDPSQFGQFFQVMIDKGGDATPEILSDHPSLANRVVAAKKRATDLGTTYDKFRQPEIMNPAAFAQLKQRAAASAASIPDDTSVLKTKQLLDALPRSCLYPENPNPPSAVQAQQKLAEQAAATTKPK